MRPLSQIAIALAALAIPLANIHAQSSREEVLAAIQPFTGKYDGRLQRTTASSTPNTFTAGCPAGGTSAPSELAPALRVGAMTKWVGNTDGVVTEASLDGKRVAAMTTLAREYSGTGLIPEGQGSVLDFNDLSTVYTHPNPEIQRLKTERQSCINQVDLKAGKQKVKAALEECQGRFLAAIQGIPREQVCVASLSGLLYRTGVIAQGGERLEARVVRTVSCDKTGWANVGASEDDTILNPCFSDVYLGAVTKSGSVALTSRKRQVQAAFVKRLRQRSLRR